MTSKRIGKTKSDQDKKKTGGQTKSDMDKFVSKRNSLKGTGGQTISDQDISKIVSRLYSAISGRSGGKTISDQDMNNAMGKAKGGKVKPKK